MLPEGKTTGMTPDRNLICISDKWFHENNPVETAVTLAHEMIHVRQYASRGTDSFKCEYSKAFVRCGGCQDDGNPLEHEAYEFERNVARPTLTALYNQIIGNAKPGPTFPPSPGVRPTFPPAPGPPPLVYPAPGPAPLVYPAPR